MSAARIVAVCGALMILLLVFVLATLPDCADLGDAGGYCWGGAR